ncbi:MAG: hypothetical protein KIS62_12495 [Ramlibacter sp.]|nr:hypothetical protein [Ramlibacter sp.]
MTTVLTASVLVQFEGATASDHLSASLDTADAGYNKGRNSFLRGAAGDEGRPAFLVWSSLGNAAAPSGTRGTLSIEAAGGGLAVLAGQPTVASQHEQEVLEYLQAGQATLEVALSPPAAVLPAYTAEHGPAVVVSRGAILRDGSIASVRLVRTDAAAGAWVVGTLKWTARARAYRITPNASAERVILLVSGSV